MTDIEREVRVEGNCVRATGGGEEAYDRVRKRRVCCSLPGRDHVQPARSRTESRYRAGEVRRACPSMRSRPQTTAQVNRGLVQRNITFLSGEACTGGTRAVVAPASRACPKTGNGLAQAALGGAGVSRGRSTATRIPIETGRTERLRTSKSLRSARRQGTPLHQRTGTFPARESAETTGSLVQQDGATTASIEKPIMRESSD
jgi:hypothetical protein